MSLFIEGVKVGLVLCFLLGPIFFTLIQSSIEEGIRAGLIVGSGIWLSDILYVTAIYWGISSIQVSNPTSNLNIWVGFAGAAILFAFGIGSLLTRPKIQELNSRPTRTSSVFTLWLKGLLVNAINPFTIIFWAGITATFSAREELTSKVDNAILFFGGIIFTIVTTDVLKVILAKSIRRWMRPIHYLWFRRITGILLITFGVATFLWAITKGNLKFLLSH